MTEAPKKHPFEKLYTLDEKRILNWDEQALPDAIPDEIKMLAIKGEELHGFFEGKEVWFWDRAGLVELLNFLEDHNNHSEKQDTLWPVYYDQYSVIKGVGQFVQGTNLAYSAPGASGSVEVVRRLFLEDSSSTQSPVYWIYFVQGYEEPPVSSPDFFGCLLPVLNHPVSKALIVLLFILIAINFVNNILQLANSN